MSQSDQVFSPPFPTNSPHKGHIQSALSQNRKRAYFVGKQFNLYYHAKFNKISSKKYLSAFNTPAFCFGFIWFFYRKMYLYGCLLLTLMILIGVAFAFLDLFALLSLVSIALISGLCANPLYKAFVDQQIRKVQDTEDEFLTFELKQHGGTHNVAATSAAILFLLLFGLWRLL